VICDMERQCFTKVLHHPHLLVIMVLGCQPSQFANPIVVESGFVVEQTWILDSMRFTAKNRVKEIRANLDMEFAGHPGRRER